MTDEIKVEETKVVNPERSVDSKFGHLFMKQVPTQVIDNFNRLAEEEFAGHRGYALKALIDQMVVQRDAVSELRMDEFEERMNIIERVIVQQNVARDLEKDKIENEAGRKTIGGRVL